MYLREVKHKKTGRIYLSIVESYRDKETKKTTSRIIKSLGYFDELIKEYPDPIKHFKNVVNEMNHEKSNDDIDILVNHKSSEKLSVGTNNRKNFF
jgi:hypothetical protein